MTKPVLEERYFITLRGLISGVVDNDTAGAIVDHLELYLRRHHAKNGHPAIVLDLEEGTFSFVTLEKEVEA